MFSLKESGPRGKKSAAGKTAVFYKNVTFCSKVVTQLDKRNKQKDEYMIMCVRERIKITFFALSRAGTGVQKKRVFFPARGGTKITFFTLSRGGTKITFFTNAKNFFFTNEQLF
jgi:hypothetical protein